MLIDYRQFHTRTGSTFMTIHASVRVESSMRSQWVSDTFQYSAVLLVYTVHAHVHVRVCYHGAKRPLDAFEHVRGPDSGFVSNRIGDCAINLDDSTKAKCTENQRVVNDSTGFRTLC